MTPNPHYLREYDSIKKATQMFIDKKVDGAPVLDEADQIVGLVGKSNVYRAITYDYDMNTPIKEIMTKNIVTVDVNDSVF